MKSRFMIFFAAVGILCLVGSMAVAQPFSSTTQGVQLKFVSQPLATGEVGVAYAYTAHAVSSDSTDTVRYYIGNPLYEIAAAQNVTLNDSTGVLSWIPTKKGYFDITLLARSSKGGRASQSFIVTVTAGAGILQGTIVDSLNQPIPHVFVEAIQTADSTPSLMICYNYSTMTDSNGAYSFSRVDPGNYILSAISPTLQYQSQWYNGVTDPSKATILHVENAVTTTANFILHSKNNLANRITVAGSITDTLSKALKGVDVYFVPSGFVLNGSDSIDNYRKIFESHGCDFRLAGSAAQVAHAKTDSSGAYSIKLVPGSYIAFAKAAGYVLQYYNGQTDFLSATVLALNADTSGINFTLTALPPVVLGTISGVVYDSSKGTGIPSRVIAFRDRWILKDKYAVARSYTIDSDSLGAFTFSQLLPGTYYLLALPLGDYAPAYYTTDTESTVWKKATGIAINGTAISELAIYVHPILKSCDGLSRIAGKVSGNSDVSGAMVYAFSGSSVSGFAVADKSGRYEINGLAAGSYTVAANKIG
ncbi:MAG TPA: carboxypeptidase-like regulatory domain-containing protein, partial [Bacteroidota bacterium]|nr:carboxypeptidase-like regulatory domain-containing protein [Bacteroidota bacterium]